MSKIKSALVKYQIRLSLGQYQHEELEAQLSSDADPTLDDAHELMRDARNVCTMHTSKAIRNPEPAKAVAAPTQPATISASPRTQAHTAIAGVKSAYAESPQQRSTATPKANKSEGVVTIVPPNPNLPWGYKLPYSRDGELPWIKSVKNYLRKMNAIQFDPVNKIWWVSDEQTDINWMACLVVVPQGQTKRDPLDGDQPPAASFQDDDIPF